MADGAPAADLTQSPTLTAIGTRAGVLLGTAAYMSPEQARGLAIDKRTDIWAFGCVLYETITGRPAFAGPTTTDTLAAILQAEPDWRALPGDTPMATQRVLRRCLEKDVRRRVRDIADVRVDLDDATMARLAPAADPPAAPRLRARRALQIALVAIVAAGLTSAAWWGMTRSSALQPVTKLAFLPGQFVGSGGQPLAVSPDGTLIAYRAVEGIFLRAMTETTARLIPGTRWGDDPTFSPDGRSLLFFEPDGEPDISGSLKQVAVSGGDPVTISQIAGTPWGLRWDGEGIVFGQRGRGIMRVPATGGQPEMLIETAAGELARHPQILPGGDDVLFTLSTVANALPLTVEGWDDDSRIVVQSLTSGARTTLVERGSDGRYLPTGHLVYARGGTLMAAPFDLGRLTLRGRAIPVVDGVRRSFGSLDARGGASFSVSDTGTLIALPGPVAPSSLQSELVTIDRSGARVALSLPPGPYETPRVSPDGSQLVYVSNSGDAADVWVYTLAGTESPRTLIRGGRNRFVVWIGDERVAFQSDREGDGAIYWQRADGVGAAERLTRPAAGSSHMPESWFGDTLLYSVIAGQTTTLMMLSLEDRTSAPVGVVRSRLPLNSTFSPDGRWIAYTLRNPTAAVYIEAFPAAGSPYQISKDSESGHHPMWTPGGQSLLYFPGSEAMVEVRLKTEPRVAFGNPMPFRGGQSGVTNTAVSPRNLDITPDGERIIGVLPAIAVPQIRVILNWFSELKQRVR